jgi:hypothetical protein
MAICGIKVEMCAGGELKDDLRRMAEIAEKYNVLVEGDINGIRTAVSPDRVEELHDLLLLRMQHRRD